MLYAYPTTQTFKKYKNFISYNILLITHTHTHTHTHTISLSHTYPPLSLSLSLTHTHTHTISLFYTYPLSLSHTHTHTHSQVLVSSLEGLCSIAHVLEHFSVSLCILQRLSLELNGGEGPINLLQLFLQSLLPLQRIQGR